MWGMGPKQGGLFEWSLISSGLNSETLLQICPVLCAVIITLFVLILSQFNLRSGTDSFLQKWAVTLARMSLLIVQPKVSQFPKYSGTLMQRNSGKILTPGRKINYSKTPLLRPPLDLRKNGLSSGMVLLLS